MRDRANMRLRERKEILELWVSDQTGESPTQPLHPLVASIVPIWREKRLKVPLDFQKNVCL